MLRVAACVAALLLSGCQAVPRAPHSTGAVKGVLMIHGFADGFHGVIPSEVCVVITTYPPQSECIKR